MTRYSQNPNETLTDLYDFARAGKVELNLTPRHGIVAPTGYSIVSADYQAMELYIAAVLSGDEIMLNTFRVSPKVTVEGKEYANPDSDLHTLTAQGCCFPQIFEGKPKHLWVSIAKDESAIAQKGSARDFAKRTNFGLIYLATAKTLSETNHVPEEICQTWIDLHKRTYKGFWNWAEEIAAIATARGWIANTASRIRYVNEDNAKAAGASPARSGVNHMVQSLGSDIAKRALIKISHAFAGSKARIIGLVHDEVLALVPGTTSINAAKTLAATEKAGGKYLVPVFDADEEATYWALVVKRCMEEAECELFDSRYPGKAEYSIAPFWQH